MNRKHLLFVVSLLIPLLASCARVDINAPAHETETEIARFATAASAFDATVTAAAASVPTSTETPAATPTDTQLPSATPSSTATPSPTETPTEWATLPPIAVADVCKLVDLSVAGDLLGVKIPRTQNVSQKDSWIRCLATSADARAGVTLSLAQDQTAINLLVTAYAEIDAVTGCAKPVPVGAASVQKAHDDLERPGVLRPTYAYSETVKLIEDKGCTDQYGVQTIPKLGDVAVAETIYAYPEVGVVYRDTLFYIFAYGKSITTDAQTLIVEQKFAEDVLVRLKSP